MSPRWRKGARKQSITSPSRPTGDWKNTFPGHGKLESDYFAYVEAINRAAKETGQYAPGRGSHGLKHNFAQERYLECINHGMSHEQALQQTSLETSHFRLRETLTYTRG